MITVRFATERTALKLRGRFVVLDAIANQVQRMQRVAALDYIIPFRIIRPNDSPLVQPENLQAAMEFADNVFGRGAEPGHIIAVSAEGDYGPNRSGDGSGN